MATEWRRIKKSTLEAIGNAIRSKTGKSALIPPEDMPGEIGSIGGGTFQDYPLIDPGFVRNTGSFSTTDNSMITDYIPLSGYSALRYACRMSNAGLAVAFFDQNKAFLSGLGIAPGESDLQTSLLGGTIDLTDAAYANAAYAVVGDYSTAKEHAGFVCMLFGG